MYAKNNGSLHAWEHEQRRRLIQKGLFRNVRTTLVKSEWKERKNHVESGYTRNTSGSSACNTSGSSDRSRMDGDLTLGLGK